MHRVILFSLVLLLNQARLLGQTRDTPRWEAGPLLSETTFGTAVSAGNLEKAVGGRVTFNLHPIVGIEYQMAHFPGYGAGEDSKTQGSGHIKLTYRLEENRRLNVFAIVGPGFLHENFSYTGSIGHIVYRYRSVAVDYGVGLEILAHRRFLVRMDITDFYAGRKFLPFSPLAGSRSWDHHVDLKVAGMFRF